MQCVPAHARVRKSVTCGSCGLRQYLPISRLCLRCRQPVGCYQLAIPIGTASEPSENPDESLRRLIGALFRRLRWTQGMTQSELASLLHTHRSFISRVEHGHKLPPLSLLAHAGVVFDVEKVVLSIRHKSDLNPHIVARNPEA